MTDKKFIKTYVTFGQAHIHSVGGKTFNKDCIAVIRRETKHEGREAAFEFFGPKFFTTYGEDDFDMGSMKYFPRGFIEVEGNQEEDDESICRDL